ncbi:MAG: hypothetical protein Q7S69_06805 [Nitrosomonadaceae bacterium]|nr:hypothetical protein [Nitrosomonadaceae bacterium]
MPPYHGLAPLHNHAHDDQICSVGLMSLQPIDHAAVSRWFEAVIAE